MKKSRNELGLMRNLLVLLAAAALTAGCASQEGGDAATTDKPATTTKAAPAVTEEMPVEAAMASVTGTMDCGHCGYQVTTSCAAALQTADGVVWILDGVAEDSELFTERYDLGTVTVTGVQREEDGVHYLTVASYEVVPAEAGEAQEG